MSLIQKDAAEKDASKAALQSPPHWVWPLKASAGRPAKVVLSRESFGKTRKRLLDGMMSDMKASEDPGLKVVQDITEPWRLW